jgi:hypothetical protein
VEAMHQFVEHVQINYQDVIQRGLAQDQRFLQLYWDMQASFGDREYGRRVCLHEAAHAVLMEQDGINNVRFAGPDIIYDVAHNTFAGSSARAIGDDQPNAIVDDAYIFKITSHMVAGGVALRNIANFCDEVGDSGDYAQFASKYAHRPAQTGETPQQFWNRAQEAVAIRLAEPVTTAAVQARAAQYFLLLYPCG